MIYNMDDIVALAEKAPTMKRGMGDSDLAKNQESWAPYLRFLGAVVKKYQPRVALELGVYMGTATRHMALGSPDIVVIGVDRDFHPAVWDNTLGYHNIILVEGDSTAESTKIAVEDNLPGVGYVKTLIGLLFLDSTHDGETPKKEFELFEPLLAKECLVVCDDLLGPKHLEEKMKVFWDWLPGQKQELHFLHPRLNDSYDTPGFGVSIVRKQHA